ncbi:MAG: MnhB domain-containing protein [Bacteroidota bacterium]
MKSQILYIAARYLKPAFVILSVIVLFRGHNAPGGGFIGGLLAASGYVFYMMAFDVKTTVRKMWIKPHSLMAAGLLTAVFSGTFGFFNRLPFMSGEWIEIGGLKLGSPTLFDIGVYLAVLGVLLTIMIAILENEEEWD